MCDDYDLVCSFIDSLDLHRSATFEVSLDLYSTDKRIQSINAYVHTERVYLSKIFTLLTDVFYTLKRKVHNCFRLTALKKEHLSCLLYHFPKIYSLHAIQFNKMKDELKSTYAVGKVILEFLSQQRLLETYLCYLEKISTVLTICKIIESESSRKNRFLKNLRHVIISPVQKFPQITMAIGDIYKYTPDDHPDKINLLKATLISKSITKRLDQHQKNYEYNDSKALSRVLTKLKLPFCSTKLFCKYSINELKVKNTVIKTQCTLILFDKNVVMLPRNAQIYDLSKRNTVCVPLNMVDFQYYFQSRCSDLDTTFKVIPGIKTPIRRYSELKDLQLVYESVHSCSVKNNAIEDYGTLLTNFCSLLYTDDEKGQPTFSCEKYDKLKFDKSLVKFEKKLKEKEKDLNEQMSCLLTMKNKAVSSECVSKILEFDSSRQAMECIINISRTKLQAGIEFDVDWKFFSPIIKDAPLNRNELPLVFEAFPLKDNDILKIESVVVQCLCVVVVAGLKVCRCLWICFSNYWVMIVHFDYKQWLVLETFQLDIHRPITDSCAYYELDSSSAHIIDSEIWIASGRQIFIHCLASNENSTVKFIIDFDTDIQSLCRVDNRILVMLKSNSVHVYSKIRHASWTKESEISLQTFLKPKEKNNGIFFGNNLIYMKYQMKMIVCEIVLDAILVVHCFHAKNKIDSVSVTSYGVWMVFDKDDEIVLYDNYLRETVHTMVIPRILPGGLDRGDITCIHSNDKYTWLGTGNGVIICISAIDTCYCIHSSVPIYFRSNPDIGPITQLIPFQNIQSLRPRTSIAKLSDKFVINPMKDSHPFLQSFQSRSESCPNELDDDSYESQTHSLANDSVETVYKSWKNSTLNLFLALGTEQTVCNGESTLNRTLLSKTLNNEYCQTIIFTFLE